MHFDLFDLQLFVHIADEASLTKGAENSCISLPAASRRVKQLESNIGTQLLHRGATGVTPTAAGQALLQHARRVLQQLEHLKCDLHDYAEGIKGNIRVQANTTSLAGHLPQALGEFLSLYPQARIDLRERASREVVAAVLDGEADIGFIAGEIDIGDLEVHPYGDDELVLVTSPGHRFAERERISFTETLDEQHICLHEGTALSHFLPRVAQAMGHDMSFYVQVGSFESACRLIEAGVGIGVVPRSSAERHARTMRLHILKFNDRWALRKAKMVVREYASLPRISQELVRHLVSQSPSASVLPGRPYRRLHV